MKPLKKGYILESNKLLDILDKDHLSSNEHLLKTLRVWGSGNHVNNRKNYNYEDPELTHVDYFFKLFDINEFQGDFLEIGCGEGIDLRKLTKINTIKKIFAIDIGANLYDLSSDRDFKKVKFIRCSCLELPFENNSFDTVYSWGVFHHTENFY